MNSGFFENTQVAYRLKSDFELKRAYWLFRLVQSRSFVMMGKALTNLAIKFRLPVEGLIKATVFNQFCSGTSKQIEKRTKYHNSARAPNVWTYWLDFR